MMMIRNVQVFYRIHIFPNFCSFLRIYSSSKCSLLYKQVHVYTDKRGLMKWKNVFVWLYLRSVSQSTFGYEFNINCYLLFWREYIISSLLQCLLVVREDFLSSAFAISSLFINFNTEDTHTYTINQLFMSITTITPLFILKSHFTWQLHTQ